MKRLICLALSIILILSIAPVTFADATNSDVDITIDIFNELGIVPNYVDTGLFGEAVSRADFIMYVARALKVDENNGNYANRFGDIKEGHYAYIAANALCDMKILSPGDFEPDRNILYNEVVAICLRILGYDKMAQVNGGFPTGYLTVAKRVDILDGIEYKAQISLGSALLMLKNAMTSNLYETSQINIEDGDTFKTQYTVSDKTPFEIYWGIKVAEGIMDGVYGTSFKENAEPEKGRCTINGIEYSTEGSNTEDLLGYYVQALYVEDEADRRALKYVYSKDSHNTVTEIEARFISPSADNKSVVYYDNDRQRTINLASDAAIIVNGERIDKNINDALKPGKGIARFIDNDDDNVVEAAIYKVPKLVKVSYKDTGKAIIYSNYPSDSAEQVQVDYDADSLIKTKIVKLSTGEEVAAEAIEYDDILEVYESKNVLEIYICDKKISGKIEAYASVSSGLPTVTVEGKSYELNSDFAAEVKAGRVSIKTGEYSDFVLDTAGRVAYIIPVKSTDLIFGFLVAAKESEGVFEKSLSVKIFDENGNMRILQSRKSWKINGKTIEGKNISVVKDTSVVKEGKLVPQFVCFKVNKDGQLTELTTAIAEGDATADTPLIMSSTYDKRRYAAGSKMFGEKIITSNATKCFIVPDDDVVSSINDDKFGIVALSYFVDYSEHKLGAFKTDVNSGPDEYLVFRESFDGKPADARADTVMVDEFGQTLASDGSTVEVMYCLVNGMEKQLQAAEGFSFAPFGLKQGDLVRIGTDPAGRVSALEVLYKVGNAALESAAGTPVFTNDYQYFMGFVNDNLNGYVKWDVTKDVTATTATGYTNIADMRSASVMIYDAGQTDNEVYSGNYEDISGYKAAKKGDRIIVKMNRGVVTAVAVYK